MQRYSGQDDIILGIPFANRNRSEITPLVGFFINTLPIRSRLWPNMRFLELLTQVNELVLEIQSHQNLPFEQIVEELGVIRDPARTPCSRLPSICNLFRIRRLG